MGLEFTQTVRQWDYSYKRDMIFFNLQITNSGTENFHDLALALYCDFDVGGPDPATGENGRLGDMVNCDTALDLAWTYDVDSYDPGWGREVRTGYMGTVILSTPGDLGMTSFNTGQWEFLPQTDDERYAMIDNTEFDQSLPPTDQYYLQAVRGIDLPNSTSRWSRPRQIRYCGRSPTAPRLSSNRAISGRNRRPCRSQLVPPGITAPRCVGIIWRRPQSSRPPA
jgi:hypothetical protein